MKHNKIMMLLIT